VEIEPLIKKRWLKSKIAVGLLYQNFGLHKGEKLVHFNLTATPWTVKNDNGVFNLRVREEAWLLDENKKWMPYEFAYDRPCCQTIEGLAEDDKTRDFLKEFAALLKTNELSKVLGLRAAPGLPFEGFVETTQGRTNLYFRPSDVSCPTSFRCPC
jgi:hypothetical protein